MIDSVHVGFTVSRNLKGFIEADRSTNVGRNPMKIHGELIDYFRKIRSMVCHAHRVNPLLE